MEKACNATTPAKNELLLAHVIIVRRSGCCWNCFTFEYLVYLLPFFALFVCMFMLQICQAFGAAK
jgi:hypothetical protein